MGGVAGALSRFDLGAAYSIDRASRSRQRPLDVGLGHLNKLARARATPGVRSGSGDQGVGMRRPHRNTLSREEAGLATDVLPSPHAATLTTPIMHRATGAASLRATATAAGRSATEPLPALTIVIALPITGAGTDDLPASNGEHPSSRARRELLENVTTISHCAHRLGQLIETLTLHRAASFLFLRTCSRGYRPLTGRN